MPKTLCDETTYMPDLSERLGVKKPWAVGDAVRCKKEFVPEKWSYAHQGFRVGKLCWIREIRHDLDQYLVEEEQFEILQPSCDWFTEKELREYFERTKPVFNGYGQSLTWR